MYLHFQAFLKIEMKMAQIVKILHRGRQWLDLIKLFWFVAKIVDIDILRMIPTVAAGSCKSFGSDGSPWHPSHQWPVSLYYKMSKRYVSWRLEATRLHDDVIKWKHFPRCWPFVWGIHWSPVNSPHKGQWHDEELWSFLWSAHELTVQQTVETPVIWDAIALIMTSL